MVLTKRLCYRTKGKLICRQTFPSLFFSFLECSSVVQCNPIKGHFSIRPPFKVDWPHWGKKDSPSRFTLRWHILAYKALGHRVFERPAFAFTTQWSRPRALMVWSTEKASKARGFLDSVTSHSRSFVASLQLSRRRPRWAEPSRPGNNAVAIVVSEQQLRSSCPEQSFPKRGSKRTPNILVRQNSLFDFSLLKFDNFAFACSSIKIPLSREILFRGCSGHAKGTLQ